MEIRGEDFIKKVQLQQERNEIEQRLNEINNEESVYEQNTQTPQQINKSRLDREIEIQEEREYSDIMLGQGKSNSQNKKKYLILGLGLIILFLLTIIIIRVLTDDSASNDNFTKEETTQENKTTTQNNNIEEQYQKIINEKLKNIKEENEKVAAAEEKTDEKLNLEKIEQKEVIEEPSIKEEAKPDVFEVKKDEPVNVAPKKETTTKTVVKNEEPTKVTQKVAETQTSIVTTKPKGTFIQIGAFSNMPSVKYLNNITSKGFSYNIYKVTINGKLFHKVLIGPYNSRGQAELATTDVKKKLNVSGAFILTF